MVARCCILPLVIVVLRDSSSPLWESLKQQQLGFHGMGSVGSRTCFFLGGFAEGCWWAGRVLQVKQVDWRSSELSDKPLHRICYAETARDLQLAPSALAYGYVEAAETAITKKLTGKKKSSRASDTCRWVLHGLATFFVVASQPVGPG